MTLNRIFILISKIFRGEKKDILSKAINNLGYFYYSIFIFLFLIIFIIITNLINSKNKVENDNLNAVIKTKEFLNLKNFLVSKINSPYKEINYLIQNNDNIEKILKKFEINTVDIKAISQNLKQKKLNNIYAGRKLTLVLKELENGSKTVVNLLYPINNTSN